MQIPLPLRAIHRLNRVLPFPALTAGSGIFTVLFVLFYVYPISFGNSELYLWENLGERKGFGIVVPTIPAFLFMCFLIATRLNQEVFATLYSQLDRTYAEGERLKRHRQGRYWPIALGFGVIVAAINVYWPRMVFDWHAPGFEESMMILSGNFFIWSSVAIVLYFFLIEGHAYHRIGKLVPIDLYNMDRLNGFGRVSLGGFLMVMGSLALSTVQSIDFDFSWGRYRNALLVGVPAAITLALLPCWSVHRRLRRQKQRHLQEINRAIAAESKSLDGQALLTMNALLARKKTIESVRTWPMDFSIVSRFILYVFIPPLAWVGAALMEIFLDSFIAG